MKNTYQPYDPARYANIPPPPPPHPPPTSLSQRQNSFPLGQAPPPPPSQYNAGYGSYNTTSPTAANVAQHSLLQQRSYLQSSQAAQQHQLSQQPTIQGYQYNQSSPPLPSSTYGLSSQSAYQTSSQAGQGGAYQSYQPGAYANPSYASNPTSLAQQSQYQPSFHSQSFPNQASGQVSPPAQYSQSNAQTSYRTYRQDSYNFEPHGRSPNQQFTQGYQNSGSQYVDTQSGYMQQSGHEHQSHPQSGYEQALSQGMGMSGSSYSHSSEDSLHGDGHHPLPSPPPPPSHGLHEELQHSFYRNGSEQPGTGHPNFMQSDTTDHSLRPADNISVYDYKPQNGRAESLLGKNDLSRQGSQSYQHHDNATDQLYINEDAPHESTYHENVAIEDHSAYTETQAHDDIYADVLRAQGEPSQSSVDIGQNFLKDSDEEVQVKPLFFSGSSSHQLNSYAPIPLGGIGYFNDQPGNSSDEAAAAWEAMNAAESKFPTYTPSQYDSNNHGSSQQHYEKQDSHQKNFRDDEDDEPTMCHSSGPLMDMGTFSGGGFLGNDFSYAYDSEPSSAIERVATNQSMKSNEPVSRESDSEYVYPNPFDIDHHPFPQFAPPARVDTGGTGGLRPPERRNSFVPAEDEPEVISSIKSLQLELQDSDEDNYPGLPDEPFLPNFHYEQPTIPRQDKNYANTQRYPYQISSQESSTTSLKQSLSVTYPHPNNNAYIPTPMRSKTDASVQQRPSGARSPAVRQNPAGPINAPVAPLPFEGNNIADYLPPIQKSRKFDPARLATRDFKKCVEPWAISGILKWLKIISEGEEFLREGAFMEAATKLFTHMVPTMNVADAETLAAQVLKTMWDAGTLIRDEEWVRWNNNAVEATGVIYQIAGRGCYAPRLHNVEPDMPEIEGRCYAHHCARTLKRFSIGSQPEDFQKKKEDWATFWKLKAKDVEGTSKKEIERQYNLHEVVQTEQEYMDHMMVLKVVYHDQLLQAQARNQIIKPQRFDAFVRDVFGKADAVRNANEEHLVPQLKFRQLEQGPWVVGFSDIFREWIRKAKPAYIDYAGGFPIADLKMRQEAERNMLFKQFLEQCRQDPRSQRLDWGHFLKNPITRLQRYSLLLSTILKHAEKESPEKESLRIAIEEVKAVTLECDSRVDEMTKKVVLLELGAKLVMRPETEVALRLEEKGREVIYKGDLQRSGNNRFTWLETHAILFDHYLVLAKTVHQKDGSNGVNRSKYEKYDVSRMPIPMDLLVLENTGDEAGVIKSSVKGLGIGTATTKVQPQPPAIRTNSGSAVTGPGSLQHTSSSLSVASTASTGARTSTIQSDNNNDRIMYPFRIKHLGKAHKGEENTYTLYAPTIQARDEWRDKIILAKERHAASLFRQNAEPFRLRVMADTAFAYDVINSASGPKQVNIKGTPLDRSIKEVEGHFKGPKPNAICRSQVNCATAFHVGMGYGKQMVAIGTDSGVYISDYDNPRGWVKVINNIQKVTQIAVLEEFSLFLVLADKFLIAYHLDAVIPLGEGAVPNDAAKRAPQKLSSGRDVGFFATGRMKERALVFYKKKEGLSSTFKVLEPVFQKATERRSRFSKKGTTEFFREFDEFYIPAECFGINLFHSSLAIQTSKGFEVMTLDKKQPWSIPELKSPDVAAIAQRVRDQKPLGMFRISDIEFLLCYEECGVYVSKHGDVSRSVIMDFVGKAKSCAHYPPYVLIFDVDFVEIRNATNGRLRQVIAGRDAKCLDDGQSGGSAGQRTIKISMAHPESDGRHLVMELLLNEGQTE